MKHMEFTAELFPYLHKNGAHAKPLNQTTDLVRNINRINRSELHEEYGMLLECAPRRGEAGKRYFENHSGVPTSGMRASPWSEEILAMALWNEEKAWRRADGTEFFLLDYQFPLKAWRSDKDIGKIDLLGITKQGRLVVIELKVKPDGVNNRGDTPAAAVLQGLRYAAIVQSNHESIAREMEKKYNFQLPNEPPIVQVLAPEDWWQAWMGLEGSTRRAAGNWESAFGKLANDIGEQIGVTVECAALEVNRNWLSKGEGGRPRLDRSLSLRFLCPGVR